MKALGLELGIKIQRELTIEQFKLIKYKEFNKILKNRNLSEFDFAKIREFLIEAKKINQKLQLIITINNSIRLKLHAEAII